MPEKIKCPACDSEISSDGGELHKRSKFLAEAQEVMELLPKLKEKIDSLETQLEEARKKRNVAVQQKEPKPKPAEGEWFEPES